MNLLEQIQTFLMFTLIGIIIGLIFDFFRTIRKLITHDDKITLFEDILFLCISGIIIIWSILNLNGGEVRFFLFLGIFVGILFYFLTLSKPCDIILSVFITLCINILNFLYKYCKKITNALFERILDFFVE